MKEVQFRSIDKLFIKMSLNDKFWVIFGLFLLVLSAVSISRYQHTLTQIQAQSMTALEQRLSGIVMALESTGQTDKLPSLDVRLSVSQQLSYRQNNEIKAIVKTQSQQYVSLSESVEKLEKKANQQAFETFILSFLYYFNIRSIL